MAAASCTPVLRPLRRLVLQQDGGDVTDAQLLRYFLHDHEEAAFTALVRRHGPMVLGVCRRVLRDLPDAEDAFQATFLVLLRKAHAIAEPERLGNWLYGVAYFTARNAKITRARRQTAEQRAGEAVARQAESKPTDDDWRPILDQELSQLPPHYRVPLVLCELEGRSRREAAQQLGWSEGTLSSRLARGRALLRRRLQRHGTLFSACGLGAVLSTQTAAAVPPTLAQATTQAASALSAGAVNAGMISTTVLALTNGVLQAMFLTKLKIATVWLLIAGIFGGGVAVFTREALAGKPPAAAQDQAKGEKKKGDAAPSLTARIVGVDAAKQTITVTLGDKGNKADKVYPLAKEVKVLLRDGLSKDEVAAEGKLSDLSAGTGAVLQLSADEKTVVAIQPMPVHLAGAVTAVDAAQKSLTIRVKDKNKGAADERTYRLTDEAKILLNDGLKKGDPDTEGKLADLQDGTHVFLHISLRDATKVLAVRVQGASLHGTVAGLDLGNNTLTLTVKEDAQVVDKSITLARDARIDGDLAVGDRANVRLSVFDKTKAIAVQKFNKDKEEE